MKRFPILLCVAFLCTACVSQSRIAAAPSLWQIYENTLKSAKYVDLTHTITPSIPVWAGFASSSFAPAQNPAIDELPPAFAVRPLVAISIVKQVAKNSGYSLTVENIQNSKL